MKVIILFSALLFGINLQGQKTLIPFRVGDKWGLTNFFEEELVSPKYSELGLFSTPFVLDKKVLALARYKRDGLYGYIDKHGKEVIEPSYEYASHFNQGFALVEKEGKRFVINGNNIRVNDSLYQARDYEPNYKVCEPLKVLPPENPENLHEKITQFNCEKVVPIDDDKNEFLVQKEGKWGVIGFHKMRVKPEYDSIKPYGRRSYILYKDGKQGLHVGTGYRGAAPPILTNTNYEEIKIVRRNSKSRLLYWYKQNGLWGFIDSRERFTEAKYQTLDISKERDFLYEVTTSDGKFGYYLISFSRELFTDTIPSPQENISPFFVEAEASADKLVKEALASVDFNFLKKEIQKFQEHENAGEPNTSQSIYDNLILTAQTNLIQSDNPVLPGIAKYYQEQNLIRQDAANISLELAQVCKQLASDFKSLIEEHPKYPFSQLVKTGAGNFTNKLNPVLVNQAFSPIYKKCDFDIEFYQNFIILQKFYAIVYQHLVEKEIFKQLSRE